MKGRYLFTSESVTEGHPDKMCDQISDAILDAIISQDSLYTMIHATIPYENSTNRFRYYLAEDEIHSFTDYVCFIYDSFSEFDFQMSCVLATILKSYGEVCLIDTNEEKNADTLVRNGIIHNMTIKRHEIIQL